MEKIKIINPADPNDFFEIPWDWLEEGTYAPTLNDLEASAERGKLTGKLSRVRCAEVPAATLEISKALKQLDLKDFFRLLRLAKIYIYYFEKYLDAFVTKEFYAEKPNPKIRTIPEDNNTDNIVYEPFTVNFSGYGDIND